MFGFLKRRPEPVRRNVVKFITRPAHVYAIGDVHGCLRELRRLEGMIAEHLSDREGESLVIYLGDYVDRGPSSAGVLDHLLGRSHGPWERIFLGGNHEAMMLDFLGKPAHDHAWLKYGGMETLQSYGLDGTSLFGGGHKLATQKLVTCIPEQHSTFLRERPACVAMDGFVFAHAGLRPGVAVEEQSPDDLVWLRLPENAYPSPQPFGTVVHGHTPAPAPLVEPHRICVDTGAYATGILTAVYLGPDGERAFLSTMPA